MQKTKLLSKELKLSNRIRWSKSGNKKGPVVILFAGIHGNEFAGIEAVDRLSKKLSVNKLEFKGSVYVITGNKKALELGIRYLDTDLNRIWEVFDTNQEALYQNGVNRPSEYDESLEIKQTIETIIEAHSDYTDDFIFADLHTTSSQSCAFILINDTLANREIARKFPVPQILGIEENINGTLLSYINNLGYKALGFEAGSHNDKLSVDRSESFIWLLLHNSGLIDLKTSEVHEFEQKLQALPSLPETYYEILYHKLVDDARQFEMIRGFENFDFVEKDTPLAYEDGSLITAPVSGRIFMPLYQKEGQDGFLIVSEVPEYWLLLSAYIRNSFIHNFLRFLPGVTADQRGFEVDTRIARFLVKDIFHLLGYRLNKKDENIMICYKR